MPARVYHRFTFAEAGAALGLTADEASAAAERLGIDPERRPDRKPGDPLRVLPDPGGRHPRVGFRAGAIRPQRETKASVFAPWPGGGHAVADVPEAVWFEPAGAKPELLYLAHTHVPTTWDKQKVTLDPLGWAWHPDGSLTLARPLPNKVTLTSTVTPGRDGVRMEFKITNGSAERLTGLRVQRCVMLAGLAGFDRRTNDNRVFAAPFAACRDEAGRRWVVTGWGRCGRAGETRRARACTPTRWSRTARRASPGPSAAGSPSTRAPTSTPSCGGCGRSPSGDGSRYDSAHRG